MERVVDSDHPVLGHVSYPALPTPRTYAVLGGGALGGFYGARLQQVGFEVHFLLRRDYDHVRQKGLIIDSIDGDFCLPSVRAYPSAEQMPACDVVLLALKTTHNYLLPKLLPTLVKPGGVVLVLQNGLGVEPMVADLVGNDRVMGGLCFLFSNKIGPGHIRHLDYKQITLGDYAAEYQPVGVTDRMQQIAADFKQAGIPVLLSPDLFVARWKKLVWNIPFNGLSVVLNATTHQIVAHEDSCLLVEQIMQEVQAGCAACVNASKWPSPDRLIPSSFIRTMLDYTLNSKPYRTSMKIDYDERRPLEVEEILGNPLLLAQQAGKHLPRIDMLYRQLRFLDGQRARSPEPAITPTGVTCRSPLHS